MDLTPQGPDPEYRISPDPDVGPYKKTPDATGHLAMARTLNLRPLSGYGIVMPVGVVVAESQTDP